MMVSLREVLEQTAYVKRLESQLTYYLEVAAKPHGYKDLDGIIRMARYCVRVEKAKLERMQAEFDGDSDETYCDEYGL